MVSNNQPLNREQVRALLLEAVQRIMRKRDGLVWRVNTELVELAMEREVIERESEGSPYLRSPAENYVDSELVFDELWSFCRQGLLRPTTPSINRMGFPFDRVALTSYGKHCVRERRILPHDPRGYLADLQRRCGTLDSETEVLIREALLTFQANCFVASVILLGAASERLALALFEAYKKAHKTQSDREDLDKRWSRKNRRSISKRFDWLWGEIRKRKSDLNAAGGLWDGADGIVHAVFHVLRTRRNDALHHNRQFGSLQSNELLYLFAPYAERTCSIMRHFGTTPY